MEKRGKGENMVGGQLCLRPLHDMGFMPDTAQVAKTLRLDRPGT